MHDRAAQALTDCRKASPQSETQQSLRDTFPSPRMPDPNNDAREMNSDPVQESSGIARSPCRFVLTSNRSSRDVNSRQTKAAQAPQFALLQRLPRQNARPRQGKSCTTGARARRPVSTESRFEIHAPSPCDPSPNET